MVESATDRSSYWLQSVEPFEPQTPRSLPTSCDVAIVGAGLGGLWTAYYLAKADPGLAISILERDRVGHGAASRHAGLCHYALTGLEHGVIEKRAGIQAARHLRTLMLDTVDEYGRVFADEGIDADYRKSGVLHFVSRTSQVERLRAEFEIDRGLGPGDDDFLWLDADALKRRVRLSNCVAAAYSPHCANFHAGRAAMGLARACETRGAQIHEQTAVSRVDGHTVTTSRGTIRAEVVIDLTEGSPLTTPLRPPVFCVDGFGIATEPLPSAFFESVGWSGGESLLHLRRLFSCAIRTSDDRIVLAGVKGRYRHGPGSDDPPPGGDLLWDVLRRELLVYFEDLLDVRVTHRWSGRIALPAGQVTQISFDPRSGHGFARGYGGDGVGTSNLSARILRDLVLRRDTDLTRLPLVCAPGQSTPRWLVEPLLGAGVRVATALVERADEREVHGGRSNALAGVFDRLAGHLL
jgi:glycine/D-amino acid oxidase-like deaminating enzyme